MRPSTRNKVVGGLLLAVVAGGWWVWHGHAKPGAESAASASKGERGGRGGRGGDRPVTVSSVVVERRDVPVVLNVNGYVTPVSQVEIRPQVTSTLQAVHVKEGDTVKAGQLLFSLDDRADVANTNKLAAQVTKDEATLADARRTLARNQELLAKGFVSQSVVDSAKSTVDALIATVASDKAAVTAARVPVSDARLVAPQGGRIGRIDVHVGSLVQPSSAALTTITQLDPIDVSFTLPEQQLGDLLAAQRAGSVPVQARLGNDTVQGTLSFVDSTVDRTTGSIAAKARFANPQARLWPGALVNVGITLRTLPGASVVPAAAIQVGPDGQFLYQINPDRKVSSVPVKLVYVSGDVAVVEGAQPGIKVVLAGGQNLRPGAMVTEGRGRREGAASGAKQGGEGTASGAHRKHRDKSASAGA